MAVGDILQEQVHFLVRNDVSDVLRVPPNLLNASPIILSPAIAGPPLFPGLIAASTWMRRPERGKGVGHELDARNDALGDGQGSPARWEPVGQHARP